MIYEIYTAVDAGTPEFFEKVERMLQRELKNKTARLDGDNLIYAIKNLGKRKNTTPGLWTPLLADFEQSMELGEIDLQ